MKNRIQRTISLFLAASIFAPPVLRAITLEQAAKSGDIAGTLEGLRKSLAAEKARQKSVRLRTLVETYAAASRDAERAWASAQAALEAKDPSTLHPDEIRGRIEDYSDLSKGLVSKGHEALDAADQTGLACGAKTLRTNLDVFAKAFDDLNVDGRLNGLGADDTAGLSSLYRAAFKGWQTGVFAPTEECLRKGAGMTDGNAQQRAKDLQASLQDAKQGERDRVAKRNADREQAVIDERNRQEQERIDRARQAEQDRQDAINRARQEEQDRINRARQEVQDRIDRIERERREEIDRRDRERQREIDRERDRINERERQEAIRKAQEEHDRLEQYRKEREQKEKHDQEQKDKDKQTQDDQKKKDEQDRLEKQRRERNGGH